MLNKFIKQSVLIVLLSSSASTYAATNASMWGNPSPTTSPTTRPSTSPTTTRPTSTVITSPTPAPTASPSGGNSIDQPIPPIEQVEQQQAEVRAQQEAIANQKTICEILADQPSITGDINSGKMRDALTQAFRQALPEYKMLVINTEATNTLYTKWRDLYIKTYCTSSK